MNMKTQTLKPRRSLDRLKGGNQALSSYGSTRLKNVYSPTEAKRGERRLRQPPALKQALVRLPVRVTQRVHQRVAQTVAVRVEEFVKPSFENRAFTA
jgi:hypothetical protein